MEEMVQIDFCYLTLFSISILIDLKRMTVETVAFERVLNDFVFFSTHANPG